MNFAHPSILTMLAVVAPLLGLFFWWSWRTRRRLIEQFVPRRLQQSLTLGLSPRRARWRAVLLIAGVSALLLALARPRFGAGAVELRQRGLDIIVAIDTSRSMLAEDAGPGISRLQRARLAALDLARLAKTDRVGLIAFAGTAFLQCPLTVDDEAFRQSLEALDTGIIPQGGTAIGTAIHAALDAFGTERENVRVLVLFTDGEEHESGAVEAAGRAAGRDLRIYTVGVGSARGEIIQLRDAQGNTSYLKDEDGKVVKSALNEPLLREIAAKTGGFYLPLQGPRAMQELFTRGLEPLPRADLGARLFEQFHERFQWPLALALLLLAGEALLPERARTRGGTREIRHSHPTLGSVAPLVLLLLALLLGPAALASPKTALHEYEQGNFTGARAEYERLARRSPKDPRLRFNAGAAAYRAGQFDDAAQLFQGSLASEDLALQGDAFYNLGNARFRLGEGSQDHQERATAWEQAVQSFEAALKLRPEDPNARHNLDYVRHRLEDLKQQQQKQKQPPDKNQDDDKDKDKDQNPDKDQKQDQKPKPNGKPDPKQDQKPDPSSDGSEDPPDSPDNPPPDPKDSKDPKDAKPPSGQDPKDPRADSKTGDRPGQQQDSASGDAQEDKNDGRMTPQQALRLLDTSKGEEKLMPLEKRRGRARAVKDW